MMNDKLLNIVSSLKEAYMKTPVDVRFRPGCFTKEYIEANLDKISSISAWFKWENPKVADKWAKDNLPNWEGTQDQIKVVEHFFENFILKSKDDKYITDEFIYRGCLDFNEYSYFVDLLKYCEVHKFVASNEIKSASIMKLMSSGFKVTIIDSQLTDKWNSEYHKKNNPSLFLIEY